MNIEKFIDEAVDEAADDIIGEFNNHPVYTHNEAANIIDIIEKVLTDYDISVPSPEDDEREPDDKYGFYGSTYYDLLDDVEDRIIALLNRSGCQAQIITGVFGDELGDFI